LEFEMSDHVFVKVTPIAEVGRILWPKKLSPKFIEQHQILRKIGLVAYDLLYHYICPICTMFHMCPSWGGIDQNLVMWWRWVMLK